MAISFGELLRQQFPPETHIIGNGLLKAGSKLMIVGSPKSYKSFVLNTIMVQLLTGGHLFDAFSNHAGQRQDYFEIRPVERVLLLEQELGLEDNRDRLRPYYDTLSPRHKRIVRDGLFIRSCDFNLRLDTNEGFERLAGVIDEIKPQVVCFDPLIKFHLKDENEPSAMNGVMRSLSQLMQLLDFASILAHHINKSEDKKGLDLIRGASSIAADFDSCLLLKLINRDAAIISVNTIVKRGRPVKPFLIKMNLATLRTEFYGWGKDDEAVKKAATLVPKSVQ